MASKYTKRNVFIICTAVLLAVVVTAVILFWPHSQSSRQSNSEWPTFAFNEADAPGWWTSGANLVLADDSKGNPEPTILVFEGSKEQPGNCFVMAFYYKGTVDIASTIKQRELSLIGAEDPSNLHKIDTPLQTLATPEGIKSYTLYQYNLDVPDVQKGNEFGFIQLQKGYVEVRGVCPTSSLLHDTTVPLSAITLDSR